MYVFMLGMVRSRYMVIVDASIWSTNRLSLLLETLRGSPNFYHRAFLFISRVRYISWWVSGERLYGAK